jgi:hypothetical protein
MYAILPPKAMKIAIFGVIWKELKLVNCETQTMIILERKPNDRCRCGSEKKFKKCCMNIEYDDFKDIMLIDGDLPDEAFKDGREAMENTDLQLLYFPHLFIRNPAGFSQEQITKIGEHLLSCKQKYPNNPSILNLLYHFHNVQEETEIALAYLEETRDRFPRYVHGKIVCAQHALDEYHVDEALGYLNNSNTLKEFDPIRSVFSVGEAAAFHGFLVECYARKGDEALVDRHYKNLTKAVSMSSGKDYDSYVRSARDSIQRWNLAYVEVVKEMMRKQLREQIFGKPKESETLVE